MTTTIQTKPASRSLKEIMREHPLISYFFLAYAFSWIVSLPYVLSAWNILPGNYISVYALKQWFGPALAGFIMAGVIEGKDGVRNLRRRCVQWRAGWQWYLFILLGVPALLLLGIMFLPGAFANYQGLPANFLVNYLVTFVFVFFGVGLPEEIGWRGFALPRMQPRYGPLRGTLLLGVVWAFWHLFFFFGPGHGGGSGTSVATLLINFSIFFLMVVSLNILFTWIYNHTRGSVFMAGLLHAAIDTPQLVWLPLFFAVGTTNSSVGEMSINLALLIPFGVVALVIVILTRGQLGYQPNLEDVLKPGTSEAKPAVKPEMPDKETNAEKKGRRVLIEYVIVTAILIVTSFTPYKMTGILIVIAYLFIEAFFRKRQMDEIGFNLRRVPVDLRENLLFLLLVVFVAPLLTVFLGKLFAPEYFTHVLARVTPYVDMSSMSGLFAQLLVLALGEEIVFRAFLQGRLSLYMDSRWAILFSAFVFAAVHFALGGAVIVGLDLLSVFVDGLLYGIIFRRSNNVYASTIAHFLANSFGILILIFISRGM